MYKIGEWSKAGKDFSSVFNTNIRPFYDGQATLIFKKICINPFVFDDYLHRLYGDYEQQGQSMDDIIREHYGKEGVKLINKLL